MKRILKYFIVRISLTIPMIFILLTFVFFVLRVMPGDPVSSMLGAHAPKRVIEQKRKEMGLDKPITSQYIDYLKNLIQLDLGKSMIYEQKVSKPIKEKLPATLELIIFGLILALVIGVSFGSFAANNRGTKRDTAIRLYGLIVFCIPAYWMGLMLQLIFGVWLRWFPISGRTGTRVFPSTFEKTGFYMIDTVLNQDFAALGDVLMHLILPSITLALILSGIFVRITRANMLDTLNSDYILAARARGLPENRVVYKHALKNTLVPILTMLGLQFAILLANAVLTETTFSWPGMARLLMERIYKRDYPTIQGIIVIFALIVNLTSLIVDLIYAWIDPRVEY